MQATWRMGNFITSGAGVQVAGIRYGIAWKKSDTASLVRTAIRVGFRGIDTACQPRCCREQRVKSTSMTIRGSLSLPPMRQRRTSTRQPGAAPHALANGPGWGAVEAAAQTAPPPAAARTFRP